MVLLVIMILLKLGSRLQQHVRLVPTKLYNNDDDGDVGDDDVARLFESIY